MSEPTRLPRASLGALLDQALAHVREKRLPEARQTLDRVEERLAEIPESDPRRGEHAAVLGYVLRLQGDNARAQTLLRDLVDRAQRFGWFGPATQAGVQLGWLSRGTEGVAAAERWMRDAVRWAERSGDADLVVQANCALGEVLSMNGDRSGAERALELASEAAAGAESRFRVELSRANLADRHGRPDEAEAALRAAARIAPGPVAAYEVAFHRAKVAMSRGDGEAALKHGRRAVKLAEDWGSRLVQAGARMLVGEVSRSLGRLDEAERAYRGAETLYGSVLAASIARLNRAQVAMARAEYAVAAELAEPLLPRFRGNPIALSAAELCLIPATADPARIASLAADAIGRVAATGVVHSDLADLAGRAARVSADRGQSVVAARLAALAHDQWRRSGNLAEQVRTTGQLRELRAGGAPIPLRGFLLEGVIGEGASGTVWRGQHATSGELVAIKVLRGGPSVTATVRGMFARELRAVAGLDHPNVVWMLDHGWVDEAAAVLDPRLEVDSPFLALEYAPHGTMDPRCGALPWDQALPILLAVLDALAHAHARGLLHLDLKPANVLVSGTKDLPVPKLADFGLARAPAPGRQLRATGTPAYMAPEQFGQDAGALGPWTDLYALGCLITAVVTGSPPFGVRGAAALRDAHLNHRPPPMVPATPVPSGLLRIVERLLEKSPADRYRSAADVARALAQLGPPDLESGEVPVVRPRRASTTILIPVVETHLEAPSDSGSDAPSAVPHRWDEGRVERDRGLIAAGLGLVSLRRPLTVGRTGDRNELWRLLRQVATTNAGAAVVLSGPEGAGARHLVRWVAERGHELGAARGLMVDPERGVPDVLRATDEGQLAIELARLSGFRPLVVGLMHAHRIAGAGRILRASLAAEAPVLCLATSSDDAVEALLAETRRPIPVLRLGPMSLDDLRGIVTSLLPLTDDLARPITERGEGLPGAVLQMVRRLAEDRQLVPTAEGWQLRESADLDAVLVGPGRSLDALALLRPADRTALELLWSQGGSAPVPAWEEACRGAGIDDPGGSLERLARHGWVDPEPTVLRLADGVRAVLQGQRRAG